MTRSRFLKAVTSLLPPALVGWITSRSLTVVGQPPAPPKSPSTDHARLLRCIAEVETGQRDNLGGLRGELSQYQITANVWYRHYPSLNFVMCCNGIRAQQCAFNHLSWLVKNKVPNDPYWLAVAWKCGLKAATGPVVCGRDYATRVQNLYLDPTF